jgi:hypothetical protein
MIIIQKKFSYFDFKFNYEKIKIADVYFINLLYILPNRQTIF